jgi:hypothetical protein
MSLTIIGIIRDGDIEVSGHQAELRRQWILGQKEGAVIRETLEKQALPKTHQQCKAHFGLALATIVTEFDDNGWDASMLLNLPTPTGVGITKDMLQVFFYALFPVFNEGKQVTLSKMNTAQASKFFDNIRNFASSQWQIVIPEPNSEWRKLAEDIKDG